jgi:hypothetical protein
MLSAFHMGNFTRCSWYGGYMDDIGSVLVDIPVETNSNGGVEPNTDDGPPANW